jgi:hypothetical protein
MELFNYGYLVTTASSQTRHTMFSVCCSLCEKANMFSITRIRGEERTVYEILTVKPDSQSQSQSQSYVVIDDQSACLGVGPGLFGRPL